MASGASQIAAVCVKNVLLIGFGMTLGFPTILIPGLSGSDPNERILLGQEAISWIGSVNLIFVPLGCLMSGYITHAIGRRRAMQFVNIPFLTAWLIFHYSTELWQIFLALCITGLSGGLLEAPVLTYVAEITQPHLRGILSSTSTVSVTLGSLTTFLLGTFLPWRQVVLVNCCVPILSFFLLMLVPETPVWLITKNRYEDARRSIAWLRGWTKVEYIEKEFQELYKQTKSKEFKSNNNDESIKELSKLETIKLFGKKNFLWPYMIVSLAFFLGHFNGNTTLAIYAIKIFSVLKAPIDKYYATVLMGVVQLLGCILSAILINFLGKRVLNLISVFGSGVCFMVVATYAYFINVHYFDVNINITNNITIATTGDNDEIFHWIPVTFLVLSAFMTYLAIKVLPWVLIGEVYSTDTRATGSGISSGTGYIFGFISNKIFLGSVSTLSLPGMFWLNGLIGLFGTVLLYYVLPETEGKTLFEITEHFAGRSKLTNSVRRKKYMNGHMNKAFKPDIESPNTEGKF